MPSLVRSAACRGLAVVALICAPLTPLRANDDLVVGVVAVDAYGDLKKQVGWVGEQVGNPQLAGLAESFIMMATQFKGLAGLDVARPIGIVVTANGDMPVVHGYVPVKNLDQLLEVLQGTVGPAQKDGTKRILTPPGMPPIEIIEKDGWAVLSMQGSPAGPANAEALITKVTGELSIGAQVFPSAMPEPMREQLKAMVEQATSAAADPRQPIDAAAVSAAFDSLAETEYLMMGAAVDPAKERVFFESRTVMVAGSDAAAVWATAGKTDGGPALPMGADGKTPAVRAHHAQAVPAATRAALEATLVQALPAGTGDPVRDSMSGILQDIVVAMLDAGGLTGGLTVDTSAITPDSVLPAITLAAKIKEGPALEAQLKKRLSQEGSLPPQAKVEFDTGKQGGANLHELTIDLEGVPGAEKIGGKITATLAVSKDRVCLLMGGDITKRLASAIEEAGHADAAKKPLTGLDVSVAGLMAYAATVMKTIDADDPAAAALSQVAKEAASKPSALMQLVVRPIERGVAMRFSVDAGGVQAIAAAVTAQMSLAAPPRPTVLP